MSRARSISAGISVLVLAVLPAACVVPMPEDAIFEDDATQLQIRSVQSREYEVTDRIRAMRAIIATLLDLDFVIDEADSELGVITATRMSGYLLSATIVVTEKDDAHLQVRARMQTGWTPLAGTAVYELHASNTVPDEAYREFFNSLGKNLFVTSLWNPLP
jgi:hypothetical protein